MERTKTDTELASLREQSIKVIETHLPTLTDAELIELLALEEQQDTPRVTLVNAITSLQAERREAAGGDGSEQPAAKSGTQGADAGDGAPAATPAWLHEDYDGPLTADQAQRRIALFGQHTTKPATAPATK